MKKAEHIAELMQVVCANLQNLTQHSLLHAIRNVERCYMLDVFDLNQMSIREKQSCMPVVNYAKFFCCCRPCGKSAAHVRAEMKQWHLLANQHSPADALNAILTRPAFSFYKDSYHFSIKFLLIKELCNDQIKISCAMTECDYNRQGYFVDTDFNGEVERQTLHWLNINKPAYQSLLGCNL